MNKYNQLFTLLTKLTERAFATHLKVNEHTVLIISTYYRESFQTINCYCNNFTLYYNFPKDIGKMLVNEPVYLSQVILEPDSQIDCLFGLINWRTSDYVELLDTNQGSQFNFKD